MIRPGGKAQKIAEKVMRGKNVKVVKTKKPKKVELTGPYLQH